MKNGMKGNPSEWEGRYVLVKMLTPLKEGVDIDFGLLKYSAGEGCVRKIATNWRLMV